MVDSIPCSPVKDIQEEQVVPEIARHRGMYGLSLCFICFSFFVEKKKMKNRGKKYLKKKSKKNLIVFVQSNSREDTFVAGKIESEHLPCQ
jgi:hypothetical protein